MNDEHESKIDTQEPGRRGYRRGRGHSRPAGRLGRENRVRSRRLHARSAGAACGDEKDERAAFEALRAQLKSAGCRVTALDEAIAEESGDVGGRGPTQADILIDLAQTAELFHALDGTGFADLDINGHRETWPIRTKGFRRWLARRFFDATQGAPSSEALQSALNVIEARAHFDAPERVVHVRVGGLDERLYLDLGDATPAGGGDRCSGLASDRQSAGAVSSCRWDAAFAGAGGRWVDRDPAVLPQCAVG